MVSSTDCAGLGAAGQPAGVCAWPVAAMSHCAAHDLACRHCRLWLLHCKTPAVTAAPQTSWPDKAGHLARRGLLTLLMQWTMFDGCVPKMPRQLDMQGAPGPRRCLVAGAGHGLELQTAQTAGGCKASALVRAWQACCELHAAASCQCAADGHVPGSGRCPGGSSRAGPRHQRAATKRSQSWCSPRSCSRG